MSSKPNVVPLKSKYQTTPWAPQIQSSAEDYETQKKAAATYTSYYGGKAEVDVVAPPAPEQTPPKVPVLTTSYFAAPNVFAWGRTPSGAAAPPAEEEPRVHFTIDLGGLRTTEQKCLDATNDAVNAYEDLRLKVQAAAASPTLFGQMVGEESPGFASTEGVWVPLDDTADPLNQMGTDFAAQINPSMLRQLEAAAGAIELMGVFNALLNNTGQIYAQSDHDSRLD